MEAMNDRGAAAPSAIVIDLRGQSLTPRITDALAQTRSHLVFVGGSSDLKEPLLERISQARTDKLAACRTMPRPTTIGTIADAIQEEMSRSGSQRATVPEP
jgi:hypothetical protein